MEPQSLTLGVIITALALLVVLWPFVSQRAERANERVSTDMEGLLVRRDAIYSTIRDLDFDYETGKLTEGDHRAQRETWVQAGIAVLKALDALEAQGAVIPAPNAAARPMPGTTPPGAAAPGTTPPDDLDEQIETAIRARRTA